jgi:hypothetical protein
MFSNRTGLELDVHPLTVRLACVTHVSVPDYFANAAEKLSSNLVTRDSSGRMLFVTGTCACWPELGLTGRECTPEGHGYFFLLAFATVMIFLFGRLIQAGNMVCSRKLISRKQRLLAMLASLQYISQKLWLFSWFDVYFIVESKSMMLYFADLGFTLASLFMFMFVCAMVHQTASFVRVGCKGTLEWRLMWIERIFAVMPFIVAAVTWVLMLGGKGRSRLFILIFQSLIVISVVT